MEKYDHKEKEKKLEPRVVEVAHNKDKENLLPNKAWGETIKRKFNQFKEAIGFTKDSETLEKTRDEEIKNYEKQAIIDGVNFSRCQIGEIVDDYKNGKRVEFETFSPYLSDYNTATGEIWRDKLVKTDEIGLEIGKTLRSIFPEARVISLYDEYNSSMPDTADSRGAPFFGPQIKFSEETKNNFVENIKQLLKDRKIIKDGDKEGEQYLLASESSKIKDAEELVKQLEVKGNIKRVGEAIYFINPQAENQNYSETQLRTKQGRWLCEALDSSSYIKPENLDITHLVVLPNHFKEQQDKVWEILRVLGIKSDRYHNIFFDENIDPQKTAEIIKKEFRKYL